MTSRYLAIDGDSVGKRIELSLLTDTDEQIHALSHAIHLQFSQLATLCTRAGLKLLIAGGDNILAHGVPTTELIVAVFATAGPVTVSVGIGDRASLAHLALRTSKARGGARTTTVHIVDSLTLEFLDGPS